MSMADARHRRSRRQGFTLIESIVVILLIGILAAVAGVFIVQPFEAARDMSRRAELVDAAETALNRMTREIRLAVPNSVRVDTNALELLRSRTGGRYRRLLRSDGSGDALDPTVSADTFDVLGGLPDGQTVDTRPPGRDCATGQGDCIVINNTGTTGFDAYQQDTVAALVQPATGPDQLRFDTNEATGTPAFPAHSPNQRFQVLDTVVSYLCRNGRIERVAGYGLRSSQPGVSFSPSSATGPDILADDVTACDFDYDAGAGERHGLVTIDITIERDGETVRLVDQAHVVNVP